MSQVEPEDNLKKSISYLWPLPPQGHGTPYLEGLGSYCARLTYTHLCPLAEIVNQTIWRMERAAPRSTDDLRKAFRSTLPLSYPRTHARRLALILNYGLGSSDFDSLALGLLDDQVSPIGLFRSSRWWCSECLRNDAVPYDRLIWALLIEPRCSIHEIALCSICPHCQARQFEYSRTGGIDRCSSCGLSLVHAQTNIVRNVQPQIGERDLLEIIRISTVDSRNRYVSNAIGRFFDEYRKIVPPRSQLDVTSLSRKPPALCGRRLVQLKVAIDVAGSLGVTLHQLLSSPENAARSITLNLYLNTPEVNHSKAMPVAWTNQYRRADVPCKNSVDVEARYSHNHMADIDEMRTITWGSTEGERLRAQIAAMPFRIAEINRKAAAAWVREIGLPGLANGRWPSVRQVVKELRRDRAPLTQFISYEFKKQIDNLSNDDYVNLYESVKRCWGPKSPQALGWRARKSRQH